jgi:kynurenine formamidase
MTMASAPSALMSRDEFDDLFAKLRSWETWGSDDAKGALNYLTPERLRAAAGLVVSGRTVGLGHGLETDQGPDNPDPVEHRMTALPTAGQEATTSFACDWFAVACHGDAHSHIDALCHVAYRGVLYNGVPAGEVTSTGAPRLGAESFKDGIAGRGVLLDIPAVRRVTWLEPGDAVSVSDLEAAQDAQGVRVGPGDILLCRIGHHARRRALGAWDAANHKTGLDPRAMTWVRDRNVAAMGSDGDSDTVPSLVDDVSYPVHVLAMCAMGVVLMDCLDLDGLARACAQEDRWEFLLTIAPLVLRHGTGTPVNPIAIF